MKGPAAFLVLFLLSSVTALAQPSGANLEITPFYHHVNFLSGFNPSRMEKVTRAMEAIVAVVKTQAFKDAVLSFKNKNGELRFNENRGLSNQQIYELLVSGAERLRPVADQTMDLNLIWYRKNNDTVGYTYASSDRTWINGRFHDGYTIPQMSRNLFHEWTHKMGFGHKSRSSSVRRWTVPYGLGRKMEELVKEAMERGEL